MRDRQSLLERMRPSELGEGVWKPVLTKDEEQEEEE